MPGVWFEVTAGSPTFYVYNAIQNGAHRGRWVGA